MYRYGTTALPGEVIFSKSLERASSARTRIEHDFDVSTIRPRFDLELADERPFKNGTVYFRYRPGG